MKRLPNTRRCFACGDSNPAGLFLHLRTDGRKVEAEYVPKPEHAGFTHAVHGGLITTALDEVMAWAVIVGTKRPSYSAELTVRFTHPVVVGEPSLLMGELIINRRNRLFEARSEIRNAQGVLCATATGKYLPLGPEAMQLALQDFPAGEFRDWLTNEISGSSVPSTF